MSVENLNRELKKNSEEVVKLHNEERDLKIKQAQLAAKSQALLISSSVALSFA